MIDGEAAGSISLNLGSVLQGLTVVLLAWFFKRVDALATKLPEQLATLTRETKEWQAKVDVALFGATGDNGINGHVKDHETRLRSLEQSAEHSPQP